MLRLVRKKFTVKGNLQKYRAKAKINASEKGNREIITLQICKKNAKGNNYKEAGKEPRESKENDGKVQNRKNLI